MADFLSGFQSAYDAGIRARTARETLQMQIDEREAARLQREEQFGQTLSQRKTEFQALQQHRAAQEGRAGEELTLRKLGLGLQAESIDVQREGLAQSQGQFETTFDATERYRASQAALEEKRIEIQQKQADMVIAEGMMKAFDPKTPKAGRIFLLTSMARTMQIDPASPAFKDMIKMVGGLEDENLSALRTSISTMLPDAQPGQVSAFAQSVFQGNLSIPELTKAMGELSVQKTREEITSGIAESADEEPDKAGTIQEHRTRAQEFAKAGMYEDARVQLQLARDIETGKEFDPTVRGEIKGKEKAAELEVAKQQPVSPSITRLVGMAGTKLTRGEAQELGVSLDILEDPKQTAELLKQKGRTQSAITNIDSLRDFIGTDSELLGTLGAASRTIESILEQVKSIPSIFDSVVSGDKTTFETADEIKGILKKGLSGKSAVVRSRILDISYEIAQARESGRLSDQDVQRALAGIGDSGSAPQLQAVLSDLKDRLRAGASREIESVTGMKPLDLLTRAELRAAASSTSSTKVLEAVIAEGKRRGR